MLSRPDITFRGRLGVTHQVSVYRLLPAFSSSQLNEGLGKNRALLHGPVPQANSLTSKRKDRKRKPRRTMSGHECAKRQAGWVGKGWGEGGGGGEGAAGGGSLTVCMREKRPVCVRVATLPPRPSLSSPPKKTTHTHAKNTQTNPTTAQT